MAQLYQVMVDAAQDKDLIHYIAAAGVLAHYVGDACQPLHVSRLHHGLPGDPGDDDLHEVYESNMLDKDYNRVQVVAGVNAALLLSRRRPRRTRLVIRGSAAAAAVIDLMARTIAAIPPSDLLDVFNRPPPGTSRTTALWTAFGDKTIQRLADGSRTLAVLWQSAWDEGNGESIAKSLMTAQPQDALKEGYDTRLSPQRLAERPGRFAAEPADV